MTSLVRDVGLFIYSAGEIIFGRPRKLLSSPVDERKRTAVFSNIFAPPHKIFLAAKRETRNAVTEKELWALTFGLDKFGQWIYGHKIFLYIHKSQDPQFG